MKIKLKIFFLCVLCVLCGESVFAQQTFNFGGLSLKDTTGGLSLKNIAGYRTGAYFGQLDVLDSVVIHGDLRLGDSYIRNVGGQLRIENDFGDMFINSDGDLNLKDYSILIGTDIQLALDLTTSGSISTPELSFGAAYSTSDSITASNIDWSAGSVFRRTITGNSTFTFSNFTEGQSITVRVKSSGLFSLNWDETILKWSGGVEPTMTPSGEDVFSFIYIMPYIYGSVIQDFQ